MTFEKWFKEIAFKAWQAAQPQWQPIETAPCVNGFHIIAYCDGVVCEAEFFGSEWNQCCNVDDDNYETSVIIPTHWQPLPQPPTV